MQNASQRPWALVTGASSGIGYELAQQFAQNNFNLIITAEDDELHRAADALRATGAEVETVQVDLIKPASVEELWRTATGSGRLIDVAAINAGVGVGGPFSSNDLDAELALIDLNVRPQPILPGTPGL